ncbi:MAG: type II toxin-antitoxin system VapC family toxin [Gammaproteobacteria bacterium]|nr:type II toxin-antitoxin system VapC family toxin [Gammaproteobacteria bacterium]
MQITVDASIVVKWFIDEPGTEAAIQLLESDNQLIAPELIISEVANAVWRRATAGDIEREQATAIPQALMQVLADVTPVHELIDEAMSIAFAEQHPVYDCIYLALARKRNCAMATADLRLQTILQTPKWRSLYVADH